VSLSARAAISVALAGTLHVELRVRVNRRSAPRFVLVAHVGQRLPAVVLHDEGGAIVLDGPRRREAAGGWRGLVACVRGAPHADIYYIDAFITRAGDVRDDVSLSHQATCFPHCILSCADLAGTDVAVIDLIPVVNEPRHFAQAGLGP
jgi:hypothetical protein